VKEDKVLFSEEKKQKTFVCLGCVSQGGKVQKFFGSFFQKRTAFFLCAALGLAAAGKMQDAVVTIDNFTFSTPSLTVAPGTRVVWTNRDDIPHTVTAAEDPRGLRSPALDTGETYSRVFSAPGTYHYFCSLHPRMQGIVVVK
jgi:plastocyanin